MVTPHTEHSVGDGEKKIPLWLDDVPVMAVGLETWPRVNDRYVVADKLWRVVEITDKVICEREPNQLGIPSTTRRSASGRCRRAEC